MKAASPIHTSRLRRAGALLGLGLGLCWAGISVAFAPPGTPAEEPAEAAAFDANVRVTVADDVTIVESDGIPTHKTGTFPNATNPNRILKQAYRFYTTSRQRAKIPSLPDTAAPVQPGVMASSSWSVPSS